MKEHLEEESDEPVPYVPSGCARTSYDSMSPEQYAFYIHWRTMARRGTFLDTDRGYMWLFCSETINQDGDPQGIQDFLERMLDAYDVPGSHLDDLREAAIGHALVCGLDPPAIRFEKMDIMACLKLGSVPIGRISPEMAGYLADWELMRFTHGRRKLFEAALNGEEIAPDWAKGYDDGAVSLTVGSETLRFEKPEIALVRLRCDF